MSPGNSGQHPCHAPSLAEKRWILVQRLRFPLLSQQPGIQEAPSMASTAHLCVVQIYVLGIAPMCFLWGSSPEGILGRGKILGVRPN